MDAFSLRTRAIQALAFVHAVLEDPSGRYAVEAHEFLDEYLPRLRSRTRRSHDPNELLLLAELDRAAKLLE